MLPIVKYYLFLIQFVYLFTKVNVVINVNLFSAHKTNIFTFYRLFWKLATVIALTTFQIHNALL